MEMSSGGAYALAVSMNDMKRSRELRQEKFNGTKEALLTPEDRENDIAESEEELLETIRLPAYSINNGFCNLL